MAEQTLSAEKLCALTGLSDRRHRQLAKAGYFPPPKQSEYQLAPTIKGMFQYYRELGQRKTQTDEQIKGERLRKLKIANDASLRDLIPADEVRRDVTRGFTELKTQLLVIPRRLGQPLAMVTDPVECEERIQKEIVTALETMNRNDWLKKKSK
jgi:hypothetical protein